MLFIGAYFGCAAVVPARATCGARSLEGRIRDTCSRYSPRPCSHSLGYWFSRQRVFRPEGRTMNWLKLAPYIVAALVIAGGIAWHASKVRQADRAGYARAMDEVRRERDTEKALNEHKREAAARDYQSNIDSLQARVDALSARPEPVVRLCKPSADQVRVSSAAGSADGAARGKDRICELADDISMVPITGVRQAL
jgi:hypothetical protein